MKFQHILWLLITIAIVPVGVNLILLCPTPLSIPVLGQPVEWQYCLYSSNYICLDKYSKTNKNSNGYSDQIRSIANEVGEFKKSVNWKL